MNALAKEQAIETVEQIVGANVRRARLAQDRGQRDVAEKSGLGTQWYGQIELGRSNLRVATLLSIARALDVPIMDLLEGVEAELDQLQRTERAD